MIGGTLIEKYKIVRQIGRGGMGVVYEAEHIELGKRVAIKLMLEKYAQDGEAIARFKREALAASRIGNPHIIDIGDIGTAPDGRSFVVMELLIGSSLADLIERTGPMPPWRAILIMRQVLRAVGAAHGKNIIHRDLKPDNIFLVQQDDQHDFVKLLDFGISKMVDQAAEIAATRLTTTGMVMGTPLYMAPEQAMGVITDQTADIYALGVILYEMLAGKPPFDGATYPILVAKLLTCDPELLSDARPGLPASLVAAVHRALEKEPENRFQNCEAFALALPAERVPSGIGLEQTMSSGEVAAVASMKLGKNRSTKTTAPPTAKRSRLPIIVGALGAGLAVGSVALLLMARESKPAASPTFEPITDVAPKPVEDPKPRPLPPGAPVGFLVVKSIPDGANVFVDGEPYGVTGNPPLQITVTATKHRIRLDKPGYMSIEQDTDIEPNVKNPVTIGLPKLDPSKPGPNPTNPTNPTKLTNPNPIRRPGPGPGTAKTVKPLEHIEPIPPGGFPVPVQPYPEPPKPVEKPLVKPPLVKPPPPDKPTVKPPTGPTGPASKPNPYQ